MNEVDILRNSSLVREKHLANGISSFNFSNKCFFNQAWDDINVKARGLFVKDDNKVVARSYNKFFNIGERPETEMASLRENLVFPVCAYVKSNGFLAMISADPTEDGKLFIASKSTNEGDFAGYIRDVLDKTLTTAQQEEFAEYLHKNDCTAVFECIDNIHDPHIVEYSHPHLVLLDLVYNDFNYSHAGYYTLIDVAGHFGFYFKVLSKVITNWQEFEAFIDKWAARAYIEGFVFEDANGFMVKYKTPWYKNWKQARGVLQQVWTGRDIDAIKNIKTNLAFEPRLMDAIPEFVEECREQGRGTCPSVIELRNWFEN
jgi:tRNA splicing ligase